MIEWIDQFFSNELGIHFDKCVLGRLVNYIIIMSGEGDADGEDKIKG